jgi:polyisoprenyl-phosphate glycosyltransferase
MPAALPMPKLSVIVPAYNEARNLPVFHERLTPVMENSDLDWEWIVVDDHSNDDTFAVVRALSAQDAHVRGVRLARNSGSHTAITCGLHLATGDCAVVLAADLQDPPELIPRFLEQWRAGAHVVWASRSDRDGISVVDLAFSRMYYWMLKRVSGIRDMPGTGTDCMLVDRKVLDAFREFPEGNTNVMALLIWMGFRQVTIPYKKEARLYGASGWSLSKKLKMAVDSITSFTSVPIRWMSYIGILFALTGFLYAAAIVIMALADVHTPNGWSSTIVVILVLGGVQMIMLGTLGEYIWRTLDESRRRPRYLIEEIAGAAASVETKEIYHGKPAAGNDS